MLGYLSTIAITLFGLASAGPDEAIVENLPGIDMEGTKLWSGFVNITGSSKRIHYLLVESENNPAEDPLIIWYNGGPGCSSMLGFM